MSHPRGDGGFTLVELIVVMALLGLMMMVTVAGWRSWSRSNEQAGAARALQSILRGAQQQAVTEGRSMCVTFDTAADTYTVYRGRCDDSARTRVRGPIDTDSSSVDLEDPRFTSENGTAESAVTFRPTGSAWPGQVEVTRSGSDKVYRLRGDGITGRVSVG